jgi:Mg/Co/Ni transporter MgtE
MKMSNTTLTLAYLEQAPGAAAKVLQEIGIAETASFFETVPARLAAPVVNSMIPATGARCLERMTAPRSAAILRSLPYHDSASMLRLVRVELRDQILAELPTSVAKRLHRSLQYSISAVGAWIDPDIPLLSSEHAVEDALRYLRETRAASHVFLEDVNNGKFIGAIGVNELLRSEPTALLAQLPIDPIAPVSNRAALASIAFHPGWDEYLILPVVGRRNNVLGGLSRTALRRGVHEHHVVGSASVPGSLLGNIVSALFLTFSSVTRIVIQGGLPTTENRGEGRSHVR